jgi:hypothetical protein
MATTTATLFANTPKAPHTGVVSVAVSYSFGATASSVGDVVFLAKIPHGARILEVIEDHSTGATAQALHIGLSKGGPGGSATLSAIVSSAAQAAVNRRNVLGLPPTVSVSDGDPERWGILSATVAAGSATTSLVINAICLYTVDGS